MIEPPVKTRVSRLENLMAQLIRTVDRVDQQIERTEREGRRTQQAVALLSDEMREFKDEMREFKDEMREFKDEMGEFKDEMLDYKTESRKKWGELANKMGTMAEDLVAPSIERVLREVVGCGKEEVEYVAVRVKRRHPVTRKHQEFDVVAACGDYLLINETKSSLHTETIKAFATEHLPGAREYFPEYPEKKIIGAVASLYVDDSLVRYGERLGLIVLGFGEDVMDVLNDPDFVPTCY